LGGRTITRQGSGLTGLAPDVTGMLVRISRVNWPVVIIVLVPCDIYVGVRYVPVLLTASPAFLISRTFRTSFVLVQHGTPTDMWRSSSFRTICHGIDLACRLSKALILKRLGAQREALGIFPTYTRANGGVVYHLYPLLYRPEHLCP
jgi:hypothetical protein